MESFNNDLTFTEPWTRHTLRIPDNQSKMAARLCVYFDVFIETATSIILYTSYGEFTIYTNIYWVICILKVIFIIIKDSQITPTRLY